MQHGQLLIINYRINLSTFLMLIVLLIFLGTPQLAQFSPSIIPALLWRKCGSKVNCVLLTPRSSEMKCVVFKNQKPQIKE